ncbi:hypothetical protein AB0D57_44685 [Streptomyces sp. NPDC048275]|uniref:allene oxide cyclase barrel-like domain-containing protein n=1 Tax=Streptomyces sp. NPDC048275 TaxID=3155629 RepID=UPI0033F08918
MGQGRRALVAAAVTASVAGVLVGVPASASATGTAGSGCVVYRNLTEHVLSATYDDAPPAGYSVGDGGSWHNELTDRSGKVVADAVGNSRVLFQTGDELWTEQDNTDTLANGAVVRSVGVTSVNDLTAGVKQTIEAWGLSGRYEGWRGERSFKLTGEDVYESSLWLCPRT